MNLNKALFNNWKYALLLLLLMAGNFLAQAGKTTLIDKEEKVTLTAGIGGTSLTILDPTYTQETSNPTHYKAWRTSKVRLAYTRDQHTDLASSGNWSYKVYYNIFHTGSPGTYTQGELEVRFEPENAVYEAVNLHHFAAGENHDVSINVTNIVALHDPTGAPTNPVSTPHTSNLIPNDIHLELITETELLHEFDPNTATTDVFFHQSGNSNRLAWSYVEGAELYEAQWVFIDAEYDGYSGLTAANAFDLMDAPSVRTPFNSYEIDLMYPSGTLFFRVRAIGRLVNGMSEYEHELPGPWNYSNTSTDEFGNTQSVLVTKVISGPENNKNWQYVNVLAEEGKHQAAMSYYDGSMRQRQALLNLSTDEHLMISESKYDSEGRTVVSILPAPKTLGATGLQYVSNFNQNTAGTPFEKDDFENEAYGDMGTGNGSGQYFSPNMTVHDPLTDPYVPDADGYPYSQVEYTRDNTGRPVKMSGAGDTHRMGMNREAETIYASANSTELHRLFGSNVGDAKHYKKVLSIDPNEQITVSYIDQEGRTIATALAGEVPDNLDALPSHTSTNLTVNLQENNSIDRSQREIRSVNRIPNSIKNTDYDFSYNLNGVLYDFTDPEFPGFSSCEYCRYELEISITDPDGNTVQIDDNGTLVDVFFRDIPPSAFTPDCAAPNYPATIINLPTITFADLGTYTVTKILKIKTDELDMQLADALDLAGLNQSYLNSLITQYQNNIDPCACATSCEDHCRCKVMTDNPSLDPNVPADLLAINQMVEECVESDCADYLEAQIDAGGANVCLGIYNQLKDDVSPGGFHFDSPTSSDFWVNASNNSTFHDAQGAVLSPQPAIAFVADPANWESQWAEDLVEQHREYCLYEQHCIDAYNREFHTPMSQITDWNQALTTGYLDPLDFKNDNNPHLSSAQAIMLNGTNIVSSITAGNNDPWLQNASLASYNTLKAQLLNYDNSGKSLWDFVDDIALPTGTAYTDDELRWWLFRGMYIHLKEMLLLDELAAPCQYYEDANNVFTAPPDLIDLDTQYNNALPWIDNHCDTLCEYKVASWLDLLSDNLCDLSALTPLQLQQLEDELMNFCASQCGLQNPLAIMTSSMLTTDPSLIWIQNFLASNAPNCYLDSLVLDSIYTDSNCMSEYTFYNVPWPPLQASLAPGTICYPIGVDLGESVAEEDCLEQLLEEAEWEAQQHFNDLLALFETNFRKKYLDRCLATDDNFWYSYELTEHHYMLFYYDQAGNLVQTVPPEGVDVLDGSAFDATGKYLGAQPMHSMQTTYQYNSINQPIKQNTPDGGTTHYWYNSIGQLMLSQNAQQAIETLVDGGITYVPFSYMTYDDQARPVEAGQLYVKASEHPDLLSVSDRYDLLNAEGFPNAVTGWTVFRKEEVNRTRYDATLTAAIQSEFGSNGQGDLRGRVASSTFEMVDDNNSATYDYGTHYCYDQHGNVHTLLQENTSLADIGQDFKRMEYTYDLMSGNVNEVRYQPGEADQFYHRYEYDADNRLTHAYSSVDGHIWDRDARYGYYIHGPLARVELGQDQVQAMDQAYTIHGWLKGVNSNALDKDLEIGKDGNTDDQPHRWFAQDVMGYSLSYYEGDYKAVGGSTAYQFLASTSGTPLQNSTNDLFNGNISRMMTSMHDELGDPITAHANQYRYDQLQRLSWMNVYQQDPNTLFANNNYSTAAHNGDYDVTGITYDANGNILTLSRNAYDLGNGFSDNGMDDFSYSYTSNTNQLLAVDDNGDNLDPQGTFGDLRAGQGVTNYIYDKTGNLTQDLHEDIGSIDWLVSGKIKGIQRTNSNTKVDLEFAYGPDGNRVEKRVKTKDLVGDLQDQHHWNHTYYVRDAGGNIMAVYERTYQDLGPTNGSVACVSFDIIDGVGFSLLDVEIDRISITSGPVSWFGDPASTANAFVNAVNNYISVPNYTATRNGSTVTICAVLNGSWANGLALEQITQNPNIVTSIVPRTLSLSGGLNAGQYYEEDFVLVEHPIYGADRLGSRTANLEVAASQFTASIDPVEKTFTNRAVASLNVLQPTTDEAERMMEKKGYELSNHLSNVLSVVSDRKTAEQEVVLDNDFTGWNVAWDNPAHATLVASSSSLSISTDQVYRGAYHYFPTVVGETYSFTVDVDLSPGDTWVVSMSDIAGTNHFWNHVTADGVYTYSFVATETSSLAVIQTSGTVNGTQQVIINSAKVSGQAHYLADVKTYSDYYPFGMQMPARHGGSDYRFGFNGMEGDDEVKGTRNSSTTYFRQYDSRLGKWLSLDPVFHPWQSSYSAFNNNPIFYKDPAGAEGEVGKFFAKISPWHRHWKGSTQRTDFHIGKPKKIGRHKVEKPSNWRGLANVFRSKKKHGTTAPAGRRVNNGWGNWRTETVSASGNSARRSKAVNTFVPRGSVTGVDVRGTAQGGTVFRISGGTNTGRQRPLFASNAGQNISSPSSFFAITDGTVPTNYFQARSGILPGLNWLPSIWAYIEARDQFNLIPDDYEIFALAAAQYATIAWMENMFNHKPLFTGDVWSLKFTAYSIDSPGNVNFQYRVKSRAWRQYGAGVQKSSFLSRWHWLMYGYN